MPGGDRTGPMGMGAMTGRAAGFCAGAATGGYASAGLGRGRGAGLGRARGRGGAGRGFRGMGHGYRPRGAFRGADQPRQGAFQGPAGLSETQMLNRQAEALQAELEAIRRRLSELGENQES